MAAYTYQEYYEMGTGILQAAGIEEAALDARLLLEFLLKTNRNDLLVHGDRVVEKTAADTYRDLIQRRAERIPLQYLTGTQEFMGLSFMVNEHVLIPRQDTEILVEAAMKELQDNMRILDMCTGSGCILISLLYYSNGCHGTGADISKEALHVAVQNARRLLDGKADFSETAQNPKEELFEQRTRIEFLESDLFRAIKDKYHMIVSNPPYIRTGVLPELMPEVREHEPVSALDGHEDGLYYYRRIVRESRDYLVSGGRIYLETGFDQAGEVRLLLSENGFMEIETIQDYAGQNRVVTGIYMNPRGQ